MGIYIRTEENQNNEDKDRSYIVTARFKISGFVPNKVTEEHIKSNIQSQMRDAVSEITLSSEYYDDDDDDEWGMYLESDIELEMEEMSIRIGKNPFCEHCGESYSDFGVEIFDGSTSWCFDCYISDSEHRNFFTNDDFAQIRSKLKELKKTYLLKELEELEEEEEQDNDE